MRREGGRGGRGDLLSHFSLAGYLLFVQLKGELLKRSTHETDMLGRTFIPVYNRTCHYGTGFIEERSFRSPSEYFFPEVKIFFL